MSAIETAFDILGKRGQWLKLKRVGERAIAFLNAQGEKGAAASLTRELKERLAGIDLPSPSSRAAGELPPKCPYCGGTVHPDEVEWIDASRAICDYCGSVIVGQ